MVYLFRKIVELNWLFTAPSKQSEFPADPLSDLNTNNNELSVYQVDQEKSNLEDIIVGIAVNRAFLKNIDYALLNKDNLDSEDYEIKESPAEIKYTKAIPHHRNICNLTAKKIVNLARVIYSKGEHSTVTKAKVKELINQALENGQLKDTDINPKLKEVLGVA